MIKYLELKEGSDACGIFELVHFYHIFSLLLNGKKRFLIILLLLLGWTV